MEEGIEYSGSGQIEQDNYFIAIDRTSLTVQSAWYSFVLTLGLIGNLYIILTVWCRKDMSSTTNLFIVNLAISDLGILAISLPAAFINDYFPWPFDKLTCQIFVPLNEVFFCVSIFTLTIITVVTGRRSDLQPPGAAYSRLGPPAAVCSRLEGFSSHLQPPRGHLQPPAGSRVPS